ncbi:protein artichoke isoform X1 [Diorhabda sublineata]|uniref:protein artichoke isoform X1 n=2 Tax=Diorhabda sublineata TaxID=1163346 RepID=UPI0024E0616D|nr:protein artichoke isoform X1 [Diorhabda sublineata]
MYNIVLQMDHWKDFLLFLLLVTKSTSEDSRPCIEISRELRFPCRCTLGPIEQALGGNPSIEVNCDRVVFSSEVPSLPYGAPIVSFSQRWSGHQSLPTQVFTTTDLPLRSVDLSGNSLRRLTERMLQGLKSTLVELRLSDNLLGDTLNPIFSSTEFRGLSHLQILDLSGNGIKAIEEGILEGCDSLQEFYLGRNSFSSVPSYSLNGPQKMRLLSLENNRIDVVKSESFKSQPYLEHIDLSKNLISQIESNAISPLERLKSLRLAHNRLSRFNSDVFQGASNLMLLDLSQNYIVEFPNIALKAFSNLRYLNLSSNLIQNLDNSHLANLQGLYQLDLSRNNLANIVPGTFLGLKQLRKLNIGVNSLRTIEDDAFEGLDNLEFLNLKDNNILLIPASALGRLPKLTSLQLDYNRVAALSADILRSVADKITTLIISKNIVRELPSASFQNFNQLENLDLSRNLLSSLNSDAFSGLENILLNLDLSQNRITNLAGTALTLSKLQKLDLSDNHLTDISRNFFTLLPSLKYLNISRNIHLTNIPVSLLHKLTELEVLDLSYAGIKSLPPEFLMKSKSLKEIYLTHNNILELPEGAFSNMSNISTIDLSFNNITNIKLGSFVNIMNIKKLFLRGNQLTSFKGEFFNTGSSLEILDISENQLSYLFPSSFRIHPRLKEIRANRNKFNFFPAELISNLQFLEYIDLSHNQLKTIEELDFAKLPRLRYLILTNNQLELISDMAFHNSTQLQILDLSYNKLDRLGDRTFEGLVRLELLNLEGNLLADLPETIFERVRLQMLENINLARNQFEIAPLKSLQRQYFFVNSVDLSHNKLREIPADDSVMVNIKKLDFSFNPLSPNAITNILSEPKTVREINLAATGINRIPRLETPFLKYLNLSQNNISVFDVDSFERITLLERLDLSNNNIQDLSNFSLIWKLLHNLQTLDISQNPLVSISNNDFDGLNKLRYLRLHSLNECSRIEKNAFKAVPNLSSLDAYWYPKLGYLDIQGLLQNMPLLERLNIETKDSAIGKDQLQSLLHPRLKEIGIRGSRLRSISSGTLSGLKGSEIVIRLMNTSITTLPPALFFPVPRSTKIILDVTGSQLTTINPQLLSTFEDRRGDLKMIGLETNPIICDCSSRALRRWLPSHMTTIKCSAPQHLKGKLLVEIGDDELTCDPRKITPSTASPSTSGFTKGSKVHPKQTEPDIIWSMPTTEKIKPKIAQAGQTPITNDDTLIIGIVGGVVAFIAILIIIICIIRLRMTSNQYRGGPLATANPMVGVVGPGSSCACSVKGAPSVYAVPPYAAAYSATLPHKVTASGQILRPSSYSTMGRMPYQTNTQPYFIATYPSDEKIYR